MKSILLKIIRYIILIGMTLEILTRIFNLHSQYPVFIINDLNVKTYLPNQEGYYTIGNRRMNFSKYHINQSGFNSYHEFIPAKEKIEIALIGDSFIEGLHQNYTNSIGKKIEQKLNNKIEIFEFGHSGYDFADQLHLISAYKTKFELIDNIIIYLKFDNDLKRDTYKPDTYWVDSQYFTFSKIKSNIKFLKFIDGIGFLDPVRKLKSKLITVNDNVDDNNLNPSSKDNLNEKEYLNNFKKLIDTYGIDKIKTVFLIDKSKTSDLFVAYCDKMGYRYIDFGVLLAQSKKPTTLIYDRHWNNHGREIIANSITSYIMNQQYFINNNASFTNWGIRN